MAIRLINTNDLGLELFIGSRIPKFAILSHSWEQDGEISLQEMVAVSKDPDHPSTKKSGYMKIFNTCQRAIQDDIAYAWVDTCCIDRTSSAELSEAINSMYRWYQMAEVCYAILNDFNPDLATYETALPTCRWFTRGWCLQELIAPQNVEFFDMHWNRFGSKAELTSLISKITRIDEAVLIDKSLTHSIPVACRMSWAAERKTTREEDIAYCLLGIFDVNMPMLYGEGSKAFMRLQDEIIKTSNDLSVFAFLNGSPSRCIDSTYESSQPYCDLFAKSPRDFLGCENLISTKHHVHSNGTFALTNKGLYFHRAELHVESQHGSYVMPLNYEHSKSNPANMYLRKVGPRLFARYDAYRSARTVSDMGPDSHKENYIEIEEAYIITKITPSVQLQLARADEYAIYVWSRDQFLKRGLQVLQRSASSDRWDISRKHFLTKGESSFEGYLKVFPYHTRRAIGVEERYRTQRGFFYLACGCEHREVFSEPRAWVRLYSVEDWRTMETNSGIITDLNFVVYDRNTSYKRSQIILGKSSINPMKVTASIKLESESGIPRFELELEFEEANRQATGHKGLLGKEDEKKNKILATSASQPAEKDTPTELTTKSGLKIKVGLTAKTGSSAYAQTVAQDENRLEEGEFDVKDTKSTLKKRSNIFDCLPFHKKKS